MDIVLGVSLTPKTVRLVLVEGVKGDGAIIDHDTFDVSAPDASATSSASAQVVAAVLGTLESAREGGHQLKAIGVTWSDHAEAARLRDALAAAGIDDAMLVSELHAAGALAQTAGRAVGYESTGLLFLNRDTATLSVVRTDDGSIVKVLSRSLHSTDAMAVLTDMASAIDAQDTPPQGMFVVGSGVDVASVKSHLQDLVSMPVNAPEESGLALARGAAIAAANAPIFDASTVGLAYSQDPDGTAGNAYAGLAAAETQIRPVGSAAPLADDVDLAAYEEDLDHAPAEEGRKPFLLVGSALTSVFVIGVIALVISLAVSIRPTADQRPDPGQSGIVPSAAAPAPAIPEAAPAPAPPPAAAPVAPPAETIQAPIPVVKQEQAPRRQVYVAPEAPAPAPEAPPAQIPDPPAAPPIPDPVPAAVPPVPPVFNPFQQRPSWQQYPQQYPDYPQQQYPNYPQQQYPNYPQQQYPQYPQQYPDYPQQQYPRDDGGYPGSGRGGYGSGRGGGGACFLIFCAPGGRH